MLDNFRISSPNGRRDSQLTPGRWEGCKDAVGYDTIGFGNLIELGEEIQEPLWARPWSGCCGRTSPPRPRR
jgi:hypothetical protein